ncbi:MAG: AmmeMemoRadiSam system protein B [Spirochaetes bacterium RBG_16_49_21]|nr:MAG: AmmeMemoRadiSam system protein B [Spirochaetes bacterium RBG_16_49_21]
MYRRKPAVAGSFYPSNPEKLGKMIDAYLQDAKAAPVKGGVVGLVSPHAGYIYSGPVAAVSFVQLLGSGVTLAIILAPPHRARFNGASVLPEGIYETPLGDVPIDGGIGAVLRQARYFGAIKEAHEMEHSLEVQVPFLQKVLVELSIVPVIVGSTDIAVCGKVAEGIRDALAGEARKFVVVISTDLSHYYSYGAAQAMDNRFIEALKSFDAQEVKSVIDSGAAEACGEGPVLAGMILCKMLGATKTEILKYANSGDTAGGRDQVVGYLSAALVK